MTTTESQYMSPREVSVVLDIPESTLANWRHRSVGPPYVKIAGLVRYRRAQVQEYMDARMAGGRES